MVEIVWEYVVKEEAQGQFELAYGPGGAWSKLFGQCAGFRGTTLMRDINNPRRFLTIDLWDSLEQREQALADNREAYDSLDASYDEWTESEREVGVFRILAQGSVRPKGRSRRSQSGKSGRPGQW